MGDAGLLYLFFDQIAQHALPLLVAGCAQSGTYRRQRHIGGCAPEDGGIRVDPVCSAAVSRGFDGLRSCRYDAGGSKYPVLR